MNCRTFSQNPRPSDARKKPPSVIAVAAAAAAAVVGVAVSLSLLPSDHFQLDCCGIDNYTELYTASNWNRTYSSGGSTYTLVHPFMCCKLDGSFPNVAIPSDVSCATSPNSTNSNYGTVSDSVILRERERERERELQ